MRVSACVCVRECGTGNFPLVPLSLVDKHASLLEQTVVGGEPPRARPVYGPGRAPQPKRVLDGKFRPVQVPCQYFTARLWPSCLKVQTDCSGVFGSQLSMFLRLIATYCATAGKKKGRERLLGAGQTTLQLAVDYLQCSTCRKKQQHCFSMHAT